MNCWRFCAAMAEAARQPRLVASHDLAGHFRQHGMVFAQHPPLALGFGHGRDQYRLYEFGLPHEQGTMGIFFEWHTADFFAAPENAHLAIGLRGPLASDPHRGRGLAVGMFSGDTRDAQGKRQPLFAGCAPAPGGPAMFIEEFTVNEGRQPIAAWQLSQAQALPQLRGDAVYRVDIHVSPGAVWAAIWQRHGSRDQPGYRFLAATGTHLHPPAWSGGRLHPASGLHKEDRGVGNAFIGNGFARPDNRSTIEQLHIAYWG
jgi:hypothetical protein